MKNLMVETFDGRHAICLDRKMRAFNWVFYKHPDGQWVTLRPALPEEIRAAIKKLKDSNDEPQRG